MPQNSMPANSTQPVRPAHQLRATQRSSQSATDVRSARAQSPAQSFLKKISFTLHSSADRVSRRSLLQRGLC